jgi:peptidyl-prolyl cis-trans isomerase SurA
MREQAFIDIKPGYVDSGASPRQTKPVYSAYVPPSPKKKKVARTRFRESTRSFRQKSSQAASPTATPEQSAAQTKAKKGKQNADASQISMKPGKKEKVRFGQAPSKTLPNAPETLIEDAGAEPQQAVATPEPVNPLEVSTKPTQKSRFSARTKVKHHKTSGPKIDTMAPVAPDSAEVADHQTQAGPLGLAGDTAKKKKNKHTTTSEKTRLSDKKKSAATEQPSGDVPLGPAPQTTAPTPQQ